MLEAISMIEAALLEAEIKIRTNGNQYQIERLTEFKEKYKDIAFRRNVQAILTMCQ